LPMTILRFCVARPHSGAPNATPGMRNKNPRFIRVTH
jgi:hypothetical protein